MNDPRFGAFYDTGQLESDPWREPRPPSPIREEDEYGNLAARSHYNNMVASNLAADGYTKAAELAEAGHAAALCHLSKDAYNDNGWAIPNDQLDLRQYNDVWLGTVALRDGVIATVALPWVAGGMAGGMSEASVPLAETGAVRIGSAGGEWAANASVSSRVAELQAQLVQNGRVALPRGISLAEIGNMSSGLESEILVTRLGSTRYATLSGRLGGTHALEAGEQVILHTHPGESYWGLQRTAFGTDFSGLPLGQTRAVVVNEAGAWRIYRANGSLSGIFGVR